LAAEILNCPDCQAAKRHAYSDATTPWFFYTECEKHRQPGIQGAAGVVIEQEIPIEEAKQRWPSFSGGKMQQTIIYGPGAPEPTVIEGEKKSHGKIEGHGRIESKTKGSGSSASSIQPRNPRSSKNSRKLLEGRDGGSHTGGGHGNGDSQTPQATSEEVALPKIVNSVEDVAKILPALHPAPSRPAHAPGCKCLMCQPPKGK